MLLFLLTLTGISGIAIIVIAVVRENLPLLLCGVFIFVATMYLTNQVS